MKISYAIPVCNEAKELDRLISFLIKCIQNDDEIVVMTDEGNTTKDVFDVIDKYKSSLNIFSNTLSRDFAQHKNYLNNKCTKDWIFLIDADEMPNEHLIQALPHIISANPEIEAYHIPRINTVEGLTQQHISKWGWNVNKEGWINFPDYQMRVYKNNDNIKWKKPVHEQLEGYTKFTHLPTEEDFCLYHPKDIDRQERQNSLYETL